MRKTAEHGEKVHARSRGTQTMRSSSSSASNGLQEVYYYFSEGSGMRFVVSISVLFAVLASSQEAPSKPWKISLEERVNARCDPVRAAERVRAEPAAGYRALQTQSNRKVVDEFTGRTHPELFLPHELFRTLIHLSFLTQSERGNELGREMREKDLDAVGMPPDFWLRLRQIAHVYIAKSARADELGQQRSADSKSKMELKLIQADLCSIRADALDSARQEFGAERFDHFLYQAIAPYQFHVEYDVLPTKDTLLWVARGCK